MSEDRKAVRLADYDPKEIEWIGGHPTPPAPPVRPLHALLSVMRLVRNKEDTSLVFAVIAALAGASDKQTFRRFIATPYGQRVVSEPVRLEEVLSDRARLRALAEGTVGRAYLDFMENEDLTVDGLIDAAEEAGIDFRGETDFKAYRRMYLNLDLCHDLWHVITGYGRDALGEVCNLAFTYEQTKNRGVLLIVLVGAIAQKLEQPRAKIFSVVKEARRNARAAEWILAYDVEELLATPLAEARARLNLGATPAYDAVPEEIKRTLLQPKQRGDEKAGAAPAH